jgi:hypothetical protein
VHRIRHEHVLNSLRFGSALLLLALCMAGVSLVAVILGFWMQNNVVLLSALGILILSGVIFIIFRILASSARCPLCFCPVLFPKNETCHTNSVTLMGSHRLRVMTDILTKAEFRCPYCNEPTACELKR